MSAAEPFDFCLLIPCYNNYPGLIRSLRSVQYNNRKWLAVVVDDGSAEPLSKEKILEDLKPGAINLHLIVNPHNMGITKSLNLGLAWISQQGNTDLIARIDCGDLNQPDRFTEQVKLMRGHPELVLTGTWCLFRDPLTGAQYEYKARVLHKNIIREMHFRNVFMHPTVMYRVEALSKTGFYPLNFELVEDYALFWNLIRMGKSAIIGRSLVICEINRKGISFANKGKQLFAKWKVIRRLGTRPGLKIGGFLRLSILFIMPKELILWLKKTKG